MRIRVNGEDRELVEGASVADLLGSLELRADRVAVEHNREIIRRAGFAERVLTEGDEVEIVTLVGGG